MVRRRRERGSAEMSLGIDPDPAHDRVGVERPAGRGVVDRGNRRTGHPERLDPGVGLNGGVGAPHRGVPLGRDREVTAFGHGRVGELGGEVASIGARAQTSAAAAAARTGSGIPASPRPSMSAALGRSSSLPANRSAAVVRPSSDDGGSGSSLSISTEVG